MIEITKPTIECTEMAEDGSYGEFVIEPLERGYGITLGNAIRRVLLSSLPGAAVTGIRIDGVLHGYDTIPGVVEDTTEIMLNLKELALKMHVDEPQTAYIEAAGEGVVTAADIQVGPDVEILNPEIEIATLEEDGELEMEIVIQQGRGYVSSEANKDEDAPVGTIPLDSDFSPIKRVNFNAEDTRVGQRTDFDRLTLEVWTDESILPDEAISWSAKILRDHLDLFMDLTQDVEEAEIMVEQEEDEKNRLLEMAIEELELSVRSQNCLKRAGIDTVGELIQKTPEDMLKVRNLGEKSLEEVENTLAEYGLSLKEEEE